MNANKSAKLITPGYTLTFILVTALFFLWAQPNNLNDILIPQFMKSFELNRLQAGLVQSAFYFGYFLFVMPAAFMDRFGYKTGLMWTRRSKNHPTPGIIEPLLPYISMLNSNNKGLISKNGGRWSI